MLCLSPPEALASLAIPVARLRRLEHLQSDPSDQVFDLLTVGRHMGGGQMRLQKRLFDHDVHADRAYRHHRHVTRKICRGSRSHPERAVGKDRRRGRRRRRDARRAERPDCRHSGAAPSDRRRPAVVAQGKSRYALHEGGGGDSGTYRRRNRCPERMPKPYLA